MKIPSPTDVAKHDAEYDRNFNRVMDYLSGFMNQSSFMIQVLGVEGDNAVYRIPIRHADYPFMDEILGERIVQALAQVGWKAAYCSSCIDSLFLLSPDQRTDVKDTVLKLYRHKDTLSDEVLFRLFGERRSAKAN